MALVRTDHVDVVVGDLPAAVAFFLELGLQLEGEGTVEGPFADRVNGLDGVRSNIAMSRTPHGRRCFELCRPQVGTEHLVLGLLAEGTGILRLNPRLHELRERLLAVRPD